MPTEFNLNKHKGHMCFDIFTFHWLSWYSFPTSSASSLSHSSPTPGVPSRWVQPCLSIKSSPRGTQQREVGRDQSEVKLALWPEVVKGTVKSKRLHLVGSGFLWNNPLFSSQSWEWWVRSPQVQSGERKCSSPASVLCFMWRGSVGF